MSERPEVVAFGHFWGGFVCFGGEEYIKLGFAFGMTMMIDHHHHPSGSPSWN